MTIAIRITITIMIMITITISVTQGKQQRGDTSCSDKTPPVHCLWVSYTSLWNFSCCKILKHIWPGKKLLQTRLQGWRWVPRPLCLQEKLTPSPAKPRTSAARPSGSGECWKLNFGTRVYCLSAKLSEPKCLSLRYLGQRQLYDHREEVDGTESETMVSLLR